ncbi:hypothetical protein TSAR_000986 [Trichomalopsis sarcophagae]|uniref:Uncharacterized protein n=1 Tax=Trichomalopsis sarcophagae TaxID=543379 RepID=A0A232EXH4_9HYME|nr:hypothetical protein TSAR_000986 [Trichomalopsis sarcophagae]
MASEEVSVIALVENLELAVPRRLPSRLLQQQPTPARGQRNPSEGEKTPRVVEIREPKPIQLKNVGDAERTAEKSSPATTSKSLESLEILRRLPPGTVLIKQVEERMPIKTSSKTSGETELPRKISQRLRNKKTLEVRRNPLRTASRKDLPIKPSTSRQRLLADGIRRRGCSSTVSSSSDQNSGPSRRSRSTAPYITTRSVTRKLGNVGATYEAPTRRDELEWKEWPVHGMHERPVYHPQFGLAAEYNGRLFASFDGEGYREIPTEPPIEIVRVDPRVDRLDLHYQVKNLTSARQQQQQSFTVASATRQMMSATLSTYGRPRLPTAGYIAQPGRTIGMEHLHTAYDLSLRQPQPQRPHLEQLRNQLERMQQSTRLRMQQNTQIYSRQNSSGSRLLSQEMYRSIQQQQNIAPKCLMVAPRTGGPNVAMPFCGVPATFKGNSKGQLFFVRATDAPTTKSISERTSTITSSTQSFNNATSHILSWNESNHRKRLESMSSSTSSARIYSGIPGMSHPPRLAQTRRGFPAAPPLIAEQPTVGLYRASLQKPNSLREDSASKASEIMSTEHQMEEVLDLSKKVQRDVEDEGAKETDSQTYATDLVHYFQNFNADESMDLSEEPKSLS